MILQALYELAEEEELLADPDYQQRTVAWLVRVGSDGRLLGIEGTHEGLPSSQGKSRKPRPKSYPLPRVSSRTSGDKAFFLFDKAEYVFGIDPDGERDADRLKKRASLFQARVRECAEATRDPAVQAVLTCLSHIAMGRQTVALPEGCAGNDLFAFIYAPDEDRLVTDREAVRDYWKAQRAADAGDQPHVQCLVSGEWCTPADKHPPVKNVPGGSTSGVSLVSFNKGAFESHGWRRNANAPVSREAAEACATALNRLLHPAYPHAGHTLPRRNLRPGADTAVCYWTAGASSEDFLSCLGPLLEANPEEVKELYQSIWFGRPPDIEDPSAFYALTVSGAQGRASIRDWFESTVTDVQRHLASHFADLSMVRSAVRKADQRPQPALPLRRLLESLAPMGRNDNIPAPLAARLVRAALRAEPYPFSFLQRAIQRARAEIGRSDWRDRQRNDARAALIKAVLNRRKRFFPDITGSYKEVNPDMDPTNTNPGYLLGRLMAVIERMQQVALGEIGATAVDRYFSSASATPRVAFPRLLKNLRHHASKAKDEEKTRGTAGWLEGQVDGILAQLPAFPASLDLEQQGLFVLGYHHQRHWLWMSKEDRQKWEAAHAASEEKAPAQ